MMQIPKGEYNRAPIFTGENYAYWKDCMYAHLMSVDLQLWVIIKEVPFVPQNIIDGISDYLLRNLKRNEMKVKLGRFLKI